MPIEISENSGAKERFESLDAQAPDGVTVLPNGWEEIDGRSYVVYPDGTDTVRKLLEQNGVAYTPTGREDDTSTLVLRSEELIIPSLYLAYRYVRENWDQIQFALDKLTEFYRDRYNQEVQMAVEQETEDGNTTRLEYRGPPEGIETLSAEIATIVGIDQDDE